MNWLIITLLQVGQWEQLDGTMKPVPCPTATVQSDSAATVRLPAGCIVHHPRVGYTVQQDQNTRQELILLRDKSKDLTDALNQEREMSSAKTSKLYAFEVEMKQRLQTANIKAEAARAETRATEALMWKVALATGVSGILLGLGAYALIDNKL
jgi:hypothetical protein